MRAAHIRTLELFLSGVSAWWEGERVVQKVTFGMQALTLKPQLHVSNATNLSM
jgi:hypothetical protein